MPRSTPGYQGGIAPRVLIAPDSFKGTLSSGEVADAIESGLAEAGCTTTILATADGGEGTATALVAAGGGTFHTIDALDPLGRPIRAEWAMLDGGDAVVEVAAASGLERLTEGEQDAWKADSYGTGQLIAAAAAAGAQRVIVAAGGSATTDGGSGAVRALHDAGVNPEVEVLCDVRTPYEAAPRTFGPQKGADEETVLALEARLERFAKRAPSDPRGMPMSGCAGGLSGGLWAHAGAKLRPGAAFVLEAIGFDRVLAGHEVVLTGEGSLDETTLEGKLVQEVASRARSSGVPCHVLAGRCELSAASIRGLGLASVCEASSPAELSATARALAAVEFEPQADR